MVGWLSFCHGASPLYVAIVTLALPIIVTQLLYSGGTFTGSSSGLSASTPSTCRSRPGSGSRAASLVADGGAPGSSCSSDCGRLLVAIRENEQRCTYLGINARG